MSLKTKKTVINLQKKLEFHDENEWGDTISKLHAKFNRAILIKKRSNSRHTPIRTYVEKRQVHKSSKTKKIDLKNILHRCFSKYPTEECCL